MPSNLAKGAPLSQRLEHYSIPITECGCQIWLGSVNPKGYGQIRAWGSTHLAHRVAWEDKNGPIPPGMMVCHTCDIPSCISASHLFLGTAKDNNDDKIAKGRQRHPRGEMHGRAKLSSSTVKAIYSARGRHKEIAEMFGVKKSMVDDIKGGRCWGFITNPANAGTPAGN